MSGLYTPRIREIWRAVQWPTGSPVKITEYPAYLCVTVKRSDFDTMTQNDKFVVITKIEKLINDIREAGTPCYLEAV